MTSAARRPSNRNEFGIAIICALPLETNAVLNSLDEVWNNEARHFYGKCAGDENSYDFGRTGKHNVVVVTLPRMGKVGASSSARSLSISFASIKLALVVGVCGGVPFKKDGTEILLGDVIMSEFIVELDFGRLYSAGFKRKDTIMDVHGKPNDELLGLVNRWKVSHHFQEMQKKVLHHLTKLLRKPDLGTRYPGAKEDKLFQSDYIHKHHNGCPICNRWTNSSDSVCEAASKASCSELRCDERKLVARNRLNATNRSSGQAEDNEIPMPFMHFGSIGTADTVMKSAEVRDNYAKEERIIAFEMEGAGVWDKFNCLIIKGVSDYADSHKSKEWQTYAAAVAASVMKEVLAQYVTHDRPAQPDISADMFVQPSPNSLTLRSLDLQQDNAIQLSSPKDMVDSVLMEFKERIGEEEFQQFQSTSIVMLKKELKNLQDEQKRSKKMRNLRRLENFIVAVQQLGGVIDTFLNTSEIATFVWGPVKFLLQTAKNQVEVLDALLSAYEKMGKEIPSLGDYQDLIKDNAGLQRVLAKLFCDILEFHHFVLNIYSGQALRDIFRALWKNFGPTFEDILKRIRSHRAFIMDKLIVMTGPYGLSPTDMEDSRNHIQQYERDRVHFLKTEKDRQMAVYNEVREWIASADVEIEHDKICRDRESYPNSGDWILDQEKVKNWLSSDNLTHSILWVNGRPGTGKTYLASIIIEACRKNTPWITNYYYHSEKLGNRASAISILRGILSQLVRQYHELVPYCNDKRKNSDSPTLSSISTAKAILSTFCERIPNLYIIIDAIDECENSDERKVVLDTFKELVKKCDGYSPGKLRVLFLSRPLLEIENALPLADILPLTPKNNEKDIRKYCQFRLRELRKFELDKTEIKDFLEITCTRADGMFLFAKLVMNNLSKQPTRKDFFADIARSRFPEDLNMAYERIMDRLKRDLGQEQFKYTQLLLGWIVCSKRPLKWTEIQVAFSTSLSGFNELDEDLKLRDHVQELCGSLVQIMKGDRVELVHSTARGFIQKQTSINLAATECDLTLRCLRYLTMGFFHPNVNDDYLKRCILRGDLAFQDYAVSNWFIHVRSLVEAKGNLFRGDSDSALKDKIFEELENFVQFYYESFPPHDILDQSRRDCDYFRGYDFYEDLLRIWNHISSEQLKDFAARNKISIGKLSDTLQRNRECLEKLSTKSSYDLATHYGKYPFRCPKILCFYFHEGFRDAKIRDNHVNCHERPFHCNVDNCGTNGLGFVSNRALDHHMRVFHPDQYDLSETFAPLERKKVKDARWRCYTCHKSFVRRTILNDHMRSHTGEKPFACSECQRGFARKNDLKRHERTHERMR